MFFFSFFSFSSVIPSAAEESYYPGIQDSSAALGMTEITRGMTEIALEMTEITRGITGKLI